MQHRSVILGMNPRPGPGICQMLRRYKHNDGGAMGVAIGTGNCLVERMAEYCL